MSTESKLTLRKLVGLSLYAYVFLAFGGLIMFSVFCIVVDFSFMFGKQLLKHFTNVLEHIKIAILRHSA
jgi:hypothetical protein